MSGSHDNTVRIWDAKMGVQIGSPLQGHAGYVFSVAFSPDGTRIVSGSYDMTVRVWDAGQNVQICNDGERKTSHSNEKSMYSSITQCCWN